MNDRFRFRVWDIEGSKYHNGMEVFDYMRGVSNPDKYILEQCTGLKDKNGELIYEGDILKIIDQMIDYIVEVKWNKRMFCYEITPNSANLVFFDLTDNETTVEVIGNIHENADLTKVGEK